MQPQLIPAAGAATARAPEEPELAASASPEPELGAPIRVPTTSAAAAAAATNLKQAGNATAAGSLGGSRAPAGALRLGGERRRPVGRGGTRRFLLVWVYVSVGVSVSRMFERVRE